MALVLGAIAGVMVILVDFAILKLETNGVYVEGMAAYWLYRWDSRAIVA